VVLLDRQKAYTFWAPALTDNPLVPEGESVLVSGPYLVRTARLSGSTLTLRGDSKGGTLEIFAPRQTKKVTWNGKAVEVTRTSYGSLKAILPKPPSVELPTLKGWKYSDSLPERFPTYDDSGAAWVGKCLPQ
jgi:beta-galactosidase